MNVNSANLPRFFTYAEAKEYHDEVMPYRSGGDKGLRPLGSRRYNYCQISHDAETGAVSLTLYGSHVVVWSPNGEVYISLCRYDTIGTRQFIDAVSPCKTKYDRGVTYLHVIGKEGWYPFADSETPIAIKDGEVMNPVRTHAYKLNRVAMKSKRKEFGAFLEYVKNMGKILTGIKDEEVNAVAQQLPEELVETQQTYGKMVLKVYLPSQNGYRVTRRNDICKVFLQAVKQAQDPEDLEKFYALFVQLGVSCLNHNSRLNAFIKSWRWDTQEAEIGSTMLAYFDEIIKYVYNEEVFNKVEVPIGVAVSNSNRKYFN
jgi:hypothetical protein